MANNSSRDPQMQEKLVMSLMPHSCSRGNWFVLQLPVPGQVIVCVNRPTNQLIEYLLKNPDSNNTLEELTRQASVSRRAAKRVVPELLKLGVLQTSEPDRTEPKYSLNTQSRMLQWVSMLSSEITIRAAA